ncbi:glycine dehydrogenase (aminomethyl-transferring) [Hwanghaeella grinnelliae]|uniref:Glycine dehydrogenase (decarboxylating) n=1 Tax=Hwanghaeella grinnelliae TaxID=2500179 RepID=A0A437QKL1_9PROT|nr:aminomethyl-transferring glycine dehydrogenase [Hwanghaeella grinnelliae]RVU35044.1 glycine dehydrogenase (aminomethyl-transferring) [Hwanghaeella grinnelliae]
MDREPLSDLERKGDFIRRHVGPGPDEQVEMLAALGLSSMSALIDKVVPKAIREDEPLGIGGGCTEVEVLEKLKGMAGKNAIHRSYIGQGYYGTHLPTVILRNLLENPGWYTAYTPYQPEVSQGRLEALINFQTMIADLTGMEFANASLLDEGTAAAEAMTFAKRAGKSKSMTFFVADDCHPQTIDVIQTRAAALDYEIVVGDPETGFDGIECFGALIQYPSTDGRIRDIGKLIETMKGSGAMVAVASDLLALCLLTPPGELGADVVVGSSQRFGVPMGYGGPHAAFFATSDKHKRSIPGRLVGVSVDSRERAAYRLALQTREQHIRREKATSNICTAQVLLAVIAGMYAVYHGPEGLKAIATRVARLTAALASGLKAQGVEIANDTFFDTLTLNTGGDTAKIYAAALERGMNLRKIDDTRLGISLDETTTREDVAGLLAVFGAENVDVEALDAAAESGLPSDLVRSSDYLTHPVFANYRSETEMLRYMRSLMDKDLALDKAMIPLGSCTMKLNATTEMIPITWPEFANIHPFAPADQATGYREMISDLEQKLATITGYAAVSLQPNAGSQGEYAGLLVIRAYHESRGEAHREICLIPSSAHGTNPASAHMAGMQVVVVACDDEGNIDIEDLKAKAAEHSDNLGALMVTYPSTHGVFEETIREICDIIHQHGGQVYLDGANLNAMVGVCYPGKFGSDVSHLNLHKTFCIPHGGGGPGVGPIGVGAHLAPFLPGHRELKDGDSRIGAVSAAPFGSAAILPISWAYIEMMGDAGLRHATEAAVLNANYIAARLKDHFPILYTGPNGMVAHECIVDIRPYDDATGISNEDVAKRLIDYGFHAPTMSWPVAGTLMIEPTESESKAELDRFCDAMISIRQEIAEIEAGKADAENNVLRNSPHTIDDLTDAEWAHPYSREQAVYPVPGLRLRKYWSPVNRVDNVYGDRNLSCSCPPLEAYMEAAE